MQAPAPQVFGRPSIQKGIAEVFSFNDVLGQAVKCGGSHQHGFFEWTPRKQEVLMSNGNNSDRPRLILAFALFGGALLVILGRFAWYFIDAKSAAYKEAGGGAAAAVAILLLVALIVWRPSLIMDDAPDQGGEPSTMRILALAVVATFCIIMLRTGWNTNALPPLKDQSNWVWLVTAALGGKALQKYAEVQQKTAEINSGNQGNQTKGATAGGGQKA